jgi:hypothetical protein
MLDNWLLWNWLWLRNDFLNCSFVLSGLILGLLLLSSEGSLSIAIRMLAGRNNLFDVPG